MKICNFRAIDDGGVVSTSTYAEVDIVTGFIFKKTRTERIYFSGNQRRWEFLSTGMPVAQDIDNLQRIYDASASLAKLQEQEEQRIHDKLTSPMNRD